MQTEFRFRYNFHTEDGTKRKLQTEFRLFWRNFRFRIFPFRIFQISVYSVGISVSVYFRFRIFSNFRSFQRNFRFCIFPFPYFFQISVSVTFTEDGKKLFYHNSRNMKNICWNREPCITPKIHSPKFPFIPAEFPFPFISVSVFFQISVYSSGISVSVYFRFRIFSNFRLFRRNFRFFISVNSVSVLQRK